VADEVEWTVEAKEAALKANLNGACTLGLTRDGVELADAGYERQAVTFAFDTATEGAQTRTMSNQEEATFGPWGEDASQPITGWLVANGGVVRVTGKFLDQREPLRKSDEFVVRMNTLTVGMR